MSNVGFMIQVAGHVPVMLVCLGGMILSLVFWRRSPGPCLLTLIATGLLLLLPIIQNVVSVFILPVVTERHLSMQQLGSAIAVIGLIFNLLYAAAIWLLLMAVFLGRRATTNAGPNQVQ